MFNSSHIDISFPLTRELINNIEKVIADTTLNSDQCRTIWRQLCNEMSGMFASRNKEAEVIKAAIEAFVAANGESVAVLEVAVKLYDDMEKNYELLSIDWTHAWNTLKTKFEKLGVDEKTYRYNPYEYKVETAKRAEKRAKEKAEGDARRGTGAGDSDGDSYSGSRYSGGSGYGSGRRSAPYADLTKQVQGLTIINEYLALRGEEKLPTVLNMGDTAHMAAISVAKRKLSIAYHPDRGGDHDTMVKINNAFDWLVGKK